jgi:uncharacterized protein (DUF1810 family)
VESSDRHNLQRFIDAQDGVIETALAELRAGRKQSHWMWFVFPQLAGLGRSSMAQFYGISSIAEARAYLGHPLLGQRLRDCVEAVGAWAGKRTPDQMLGPIDAMKLRSSLTLFDRVAPGSVFEDTLASLFDDNPDDRTLALLNAEG